MLKRFSPLILYDTELCFFQIKGHVQNTFYRVADCQVFNITGRRTQTHPGKVILKSFDLVNIGTLTFLKALEPAAVVVKRFAWVVLGDLHLGLAVDVH